MEWCVEWLHTPFCNEEVRMKTLILLAGILSGFLVQTEISRMSQASLSMKDSSQIQHLGSIPLKSKSSKSLAKSVKLSTSKSFDFAKSRRQITKFYQWRSSQETSYQIASLEVSEAPKQQF